MSYSIQKRQIGQKLARFGKMRQKFPKNGRLVCYTIFLESQNSATLSEIREFYSNLVVIMCRGYRGDGSFCHTFGTSKWQKNSTPM